jgi:hypothetical protein
VFIWLAAWAGFAISRNSKMTAEKIRQYVHSIDFGKLSAEERSKAILALAVKLNALSREDRLRLRGQEEWRSWFAQMTEAEKEEFIDATLPTDVTQMIDAFERLPADKRKKTIDDAMKNLKKMSDQADNADASSGTVDTNSPAYLDPQLTQKAQTLGLKTFFSQSSPETKAELAPLLEEVQRQMESGRSFH